MKNTKTLTFSFDSLNVLSQDENISIVELYLCHLGANRNKCSIDLECIEKSKDTFFNKPIIFKLDNKLFPSFSMDVTSHSDNPEDMKIAGQVPESSPVEYIEENGKVYVKVIGIIHKAYVPTLMKILEKKSGENKVSIEILILESTQREDGIVDIHKFSLRGIALLGDDVMEGIEGSCLKVTKFSSDECNKIYLEFSHKNKDYVIPNEIKDVIYNNLANIKDEKCFSFANDIVKNSFIKKEELLEIKKLMKEDELSYNSLYGEKLMEYINGMDFAKEDYGSGSAIKVDKSKEAMSETSWGEIDKTELRKKVLESSNYKALVKDVYAKVEDNWEDSPSSKLKYPIMEIVDGVAIYNRHGLSSTLGYAEAENDEEVISKVKGIYKKLDLDKKEDISMEENIKKNKLDEENKDIEKIRDDADAQEDDTKEEEKAKVEKDDKKEKEVKKNEIEDDDEGEEDLEDDVDADKDYWKKKYDEDIKSMQLEVETLKHEKEVREMQEMLTEYATCLDETTFEKFSAKKDEKEMNKEKFSAELFALIAKNKKEEAEKFEEAKFSYKDFSFPVASARADENDDSDVLEKIAKKYK